MDGLKSDQATTGGSLRVIELLMEITLLNQVISPTVNTQLCNMLEPWHQAPSPSISQSPVRRIMTTFYSV